MITIQPSQDSDRDLLLISVFTFFTVTLWIFFEILKTVKTTTVSRATSQIVVPLDPKLDTQTLNLITSRKSF